MHKSFSKDVNRNSGSLVCVEIVSSHYLSFNDALRLDAGVAGGEPSDVPVAAACSVFESGLLEAHDSDMAPKQKCEPQPAPGFGSQHAKGGAHQGKGWGRSSPKAGGPGVTREGRQIRDSERSWDRDSVGGTHRPGSDRPRPTQPYTATTSDYTSQEQRYEAQSGPWRRD